MTLHQHLGHAGRSTKIPVDLKRRVIVEQIGECRLGKKRDYVFMCKIALFEARPEVDYPGAAPTRMTASRGQTALERNSCRAGELGCSAQSDLIIGVQREQV